MSDRRLGGKRQGDKGTGAEPAAAGAIHSGECVLRKSCG